MKISFVGAGNVAWHLSQAFENAGHWICEVYSRDIKRSRELVGEITFIF
jgi:3-hydroxyisobutyrate dehydrogenase-like beta-hydroxyacid dehydrogenase